MKFRRVVLTPETDFSPRLGILDDFGLLVSGDGIGWLSDHRSWARAEDIACPPAAPHQLPIELAPGAFERLEFASGVPIDAGEGAVFVDAESGAAEIWQLLDDQQHISRELPPGFAPKDAQVLPTEPLFLLFPLAWHDIAADVLVFVEDPATSVAEIPATVTLARTGRDDLAFLLGGDAAIEPTAIADELLVPVLLDEAVSGSMQAAAAQATTIAGRPAATGALQFEDVSTPRVGAVVHQRYFVVEANCASYYIVLRTDARGAQERDRAFEATMKRFDVLDHDTLCEAPRDDEVAACYLGLLLPAPLLPDGDWVPSEGAFDPQVNPLRLAGEHRLLPEGIAIEVTREPSEAAARRRIEELAPAGAEDVPAFGSTARRSRSINGGVVEETFAFRARPLHRECEQQGRRHRPHSLSPTSRSRSSIALTVSADCGRGFRRSATGRQPCRSSRIYD